MSAIKLSVKRAVGEYDFSASRFFGPPLIPQEWCDTFGNDEIFLCQIKLSEVKELLPSNSLPENGYLYIFLDTIDGNRHLKPIIRHYNGEPCVVFDDFNCAVEGYEEFNEPWLITMELTDEDEDCTRLFGVPSDWNYDEEPPKLLMQFDPLDSDMGFLSTLDGYVYFFFGRDTSRLDDVTIQEEYS
ncbi:MAG: hypothetical protein J6B34_05610 [Clostridia bacterium]|nr:hypothetical protein [Clostridia bacterium]